MQFSKLAVSFGIQLQNLKAIYMEQYSSHSVRSQLPRLKNVDVS